MIPAEQRSSITQYELGQMFRKAPPDPLTRQGSTLYSALWICVGSRRGAQARVVPLASAATPSQHKFKAPNLLKMKWLELNAI